MREPSIRPPLPWTTPCKGTISLIPVPPPLVVAAEASFRVSSSGSGGWVIGRAPAAGGAELAGIFLCVFCGFVCCFREFRGVAWLEREEMRCLPLFEKTLWNWSL